MTEILFPYSIINEHENQIITWLAENEIELGRGGNYIVFEDNQEELVLIFKLKFGL